MGLRRLSYGHRNSATSSLASTSPTTSTRASVLTSRTSWSADTSVGEGECTNAFVLCLHGFQSGDPDHLSFRRNEILYVVRQEATGWWAALKPKGAQVGWIPCGFVVELNEVQLDKLQKVRFDLRVYEYDVERLYDSVLILESPRSDLGPAKSQGERVLATDGAKVS